MVGLAYNTRWSYPEGPTELANQDLRLPRCACAEEAGGERGQAEERSQLVEAPATKPELSPPEASKRRKAPAPRSFL